MPHMHGRGIRQTMMHRTAGQPRLRLAPRELGLPLAGVLLLQDAHHDHAATQVQVTCEYDTSADTAPVLPGWGTRNEMCLTVLMVALPPG